MNEIPDIKCQNDPARVPSVRVGWVPLISLPPPELRRLSRFEIPKYRNFQYSNYESEKKTKMQQIHVMKVFFSFPA